jgi:hypothetical protein
MSRTRGRPRRFLRKRLDNAYACGHAEGFKQGVQLLQAQALNALMGDRRVYGLDRMASMTAIDAAARGLLVPQQRRQTKKSDKR